MARILTAHIRPHRRPRSRPEARQIAGDLDWPVRRRQQIQRQRQTAVGNRRMRFQPEQFLHANVQRWRTRTFIVECKPVSCRRFEMRRRFAFQPLPQRPRQQHIQALIQIVGVNVGQPRLTRKERLQPIADACCQRLIGEIRPVFRTRRRKNATRSRNCNCAFVHGNRATPAAAIPSAKTAATSSPAATGRGSLASAIASRRLTRRARTASAAASNVTSSRL